ncbi:MerR family transcriptional regulator [Roseovarius aestuarii]|nr:MerR family transcriptional regulator [Roseovarius aestuarii]
MSKSVDAFRTISEVADWLGIPAHVLRFWESKFTQVKPVKRAGGRRYYRPADMMLLGGIRKLLHDDGMTIKGVQKVMREQGVKYVSSLSPNLDGEVDVTPSDIALDVTPEVEDTSVSKVLQFDRQPDRATSKDAAPDSVDATQQAEDQPAKTDSVKADPAPQEDDDAPTDRDQPDSDDVDVDDEDDADSSGSDKKKKSKKDKKRKKDKKKKKDKKSKKRDEDSEIAVSDSDADDGPMKEETKAPDPDEPAETDIEVTDDLTADVSTDAPLSGKEPADGQSQPLELTESTPDSAAEALTPPNTADSATETGEATDIPVEADHDTETADDAVAEEDTTLDATDSGDEIESKVEAELDDEDSDSAPPLAATQPVQTPADPEDDTPAPPSAMTALAGLQSPVDAETAARIQALANRLQALRARSTTAQKG